MLKEMTLDGTFTDKVAVAIERIIAHHDRKTRQRTLHSVGEKIQ